LLLTPHLEIVFVPENYLIAELWKKLGGGRPRTIFKKAVVPLTATIKDM
jgi:hypothetical protein